MNNIQQQESNDIHIDESNKNDNVKNEIHKININNQHDNDNNHTIIKDDDNIGATDNKLKDDISKDDNDKNPIEKNLINHMNDHKLKPSLSIPTGNNIIGGSGNCGNSGMNISYIDHMNNIIPGSKFKVIKKNNKILSNMLNINVDTPKNEYQNPIHIVNNNNNTTVQTSTNTISAIKFGTIKPLISTEVKNYQVFSPENQNGNLLRTHENNQKNLMKKAIFRDFQQGPKKFMMKSPSLGTLKDNENFSNNQQEKLDQIHKIYQDPVFFKQIKLNGLKPGSMHFNCPIKGKFSHNFSNSANTSIISNIPSKDRTLGMQNLKTRLNLNPLIDSKNFINENKLNNENIQQQQQSSYQKLTKMKKKLSVGNMALPIDIMTNQSPVLNSLNYLDSNSDRDVKPLMRKHNDPIVTIDHYQEEYPNDNDAEINVKNYKLWKNKMLKILNENKDIDLKVYDHIRDIFDKIIEETTNSSCPIDLHKSIDYIKEFKQLYEMYINRLSKENNILKEENLLLIQKNLYLKHYIDELIKDQSRQNHMTSSTKTMTTTTTAKICCFSPSKMNINVNVDKNLKDKKIDLPNIISQNSDKIDQKNLKKIIINQQATINSLKQKQLMMTKLMNSIKGHDFHDKIINLSYAYDINSGFGNNTKNHGDHQDPCTTQSKNNYSKQDHHIEKEIILESDSLIEEERPKRHIVNLQRRNKTIDTLLDHKNQTEEGNFQNDYYNASEKNSPTRSLTTELKNKLKLDFSALKNNNNNLASSLGINQLRNPSNILIKYDCNMHHHEDESPIGFHEEFMAKLEEFSLSWRQAALKERK